MKYLEELKPGDLFTINGRRFILTSDFRSDKNLKSKKLSIDIENGFPNWIMDDTIVEVLDLYYRDTEGHIISLKEYNNEYTDKTNHVP